MHTSPATLVAPVSPPLATVTIALDSNRFDLLDALSYEPGWRLARPIAGEDGAAEHTRLGVRVFIPSEERAIVAPPFLAPLIRRLDDLVSSSY